MFCKVVSNCTKKVKDYAYKNILPDLLESPTNSRIASTLFFLNSLSVLYLSTHSEEEHGSTATGAKVTGNLILLSMLYFSSILAAVSIPKFYAYKTNPNTHNDTVKHLVEKIQQNKFQFPLFCILSLTQIMSLAFETTRFILFKQQEQTNTPSEHHAPIERIDCETRHFFNDHCIGKAQSIVSSFALISWIGIIIMNLKDPIITYKNTHRSEQPLTSDQALFQIFNNSIFAARTTLRFLRIFIVNNNLSIIAAYLELGRYAISKLCQSAFKARQNQPNESGYLTACKKELKVFLGNMFNRHHYLPFSRIDRTNH